MPQSNAHRANLSNLATVEGFWTALSDAPYAFDWFFAMRWIEARHPDTPVMGRTARPGNEPIRIGQEPSLSFAPSTLAAVSPANAHRPIKISQYAFGLFGPNGPLPTHLTELAHERVTHAGDATITNFTDIFHHRASLLFYRAWADAQSTVNLDRKADDRFSRYVDSLIGYGLPSQENRDSVPSHSKRFVAGHLVRQTRNPEGLKLALTHFFNIPVHINEWQPNWLRLSVDQRTNLSKNAKNALLGINAIAGSQVPDRQYRFRLVLGAMNLADYEKLLPVGANFQVLVDWIRNYVGYEFTWDVQLLLKAEDIPVNKLGGSTRLGWTSWLGTHKTTAPAGDLILHPENILKGPGMLDNS
jgi:type VI secretion system protein ImpH